MDWIKNSISKPKKKDPTSSSSSSVQPLAELLMRNGVTEDVARERLTGADLASYVVMPTGLDPNEWFASHTVSFFEHTNLLYGCMADMCLTTCGQSTPGSVTSATYQWVDEKGKKSKCHAPQFIDNIMSYVQKCVEDEAIFPTKYGNKFPPNFESTVRKIHTRLQQVLVHLYASHLRDIVNLQLQACLNTVFNHFFLFNRQFRLIDDKDSNELLESLHRLIERAAKETPDRQQTWSTMPSQGLVSSDQSAPSRSLTPPPSSGSSPRHLSLSQPRRKNERSPATEAIVGRSSRLKSPFKSKEGVARDRKSSAPFRPLSIAT